MNKRSYLVFSLLMVLTISPWAQYLEFDPGQTVDIILPMDITQEGVINVYNITEDTLSIEWRKVGNTCPEEYWHMEFCDNIHCWDFLPNGDVMNPVGPGDYGFLRLIVNAQNYEGSGTVSYWVFREGHMEEHIDCFFQVSTEGFNGIEDDNAITAQTFWNPTTNELSITSAEVGKCEVFNLKGQLIHSCQLTGSTSIIPLTDVLPGIYVVQVLQMEPLKIMVR
jgi:hypothetical protein